MSKGKNITLWVIQILLALVFLFTGIIKLITPIDTLVAEMALPAFFVNPGLIIQIVGVAEILGGLGLFLPALLKMKPVWTPLAAGGLTIIMVVAVLLTVSSMGVVPALFPLVVGILCAVVACKRCPKNV